MLDLGVDKMKLRVIQVIIIIIIFIFVFGESEEYKNFKITERDKVYTYENDNIGMALSFPIDWKNQCIVNETENGINVYHKETYEKYTETGLLFSIDRVVGELITDEDFSQDPAPQKILLQGNGYTFLLKMPTDIQYPLDDNELHKDYENLAEMIPTVCKTIYLIDMRSPKALNTGYKVVGTSFFTMEIPSEWEMELAEDSLDWYIYDEKTMIGRVEHVPYHAGASIDEGIPENNTNYITELITDSSRAYQIAFNKKKVSQTQMNKIKESFCFKSGPYAVV